MHKVFFLLTLLVFGCGTGRAHAALQMGSPGYVPLPEHGMMIENVTDRFATVLPSRLQQLGVRLWTDGEQDLFRAGDRMRLRFRTSRDAHVAILHIDTRGRLEFIFPFSPWDTDYVRGQRTYSLPSADWNTHWTVQGEPGIGYFYIIASSQPLNYRPFQFGSRWDLSWAGAGVRGDPFWALQEITELLVPNRRGARVAVDHYSYYVGRRVPYPSYACYSRPGLWERTAWNAYYGSCDRISLLLRTHPYYYDTRRYRGDRNLYWRELDAPAPRHGFKERADLPDARIGAPSLRGEPPVQVPSGRAQPQSRPIPRRATPERSAEPREPVRPERQRPTLERRPPPERSPAPPPAAQPERRREPPPRQEPPRQEPPREVRSTEPRVSAPPAPRPERDPPGA